MPTEKPPLPSELWYLEETWDHWKGSPTEIARLAQRADEWMNRHFTNFTALPREYWYLPGRRIRQQETVTSHHTVRTTRWVGGAVADRLAGEIEARRELVRGVSIESEASWRAWFRDDVFNTVSLRPTPPPDRPPPGVTVSFETVAPPHRIEIAFDTQTPGARLRVIAPSPQLCRGLFEHMEPHVAAGAREHLWSRGSAAVVGAATGALGGAAISVFVNASLGAYAGLGLLYVFACAGDELVRWASPPLEPVEAWEKSRWSQTRTYAWQGLLFLVALVSILLTVSLT